MAASYDSERVSLGEGRAGASAGSSDRSDAVAIDTPEAGMCLTSSRAIRHAAWMIQETDLSWRIASFCVSASMAELK